MADTPKSALAASITLKFTDADSLSESLKAYSGEHGMGGLCVQVVKYYELNDRVLLTLEYGAAPLQIHGVVAWRKPGYVGLRFQPVSAEENRAFITLRTLLIRETGKPRLDDALDGTKPFAE